jgi:hypothetical protein
MDVELKLNEHPSKEMRLIEISGLGSSLWYDADINTLMKKGNGKVDLH